jgi:tetratricopeptide (TPR) repeat protein
MGIVLKAFDPTLKRVVAIKVLTPALAADPLARRRFAREAQAAAAVSHDHIVNIHAVNDTGPLPFLVMQFIAGRSLQDRVERQGPMELKEVLRIGMQIASGLAAAHAQGLVHRDIKPSNILLENSVERVKITDFGLARAIDDATLTEQGVVTGTPAYMSPEQAHGDPIDQRADLFSLGCVLYALCTGRAPFRGENSLAVLRKVIGAEPRPIRLRNPDIPEWLVGVVARLMAKDPANRYQSAVEVAKLLAARLAELQRPAHPSLPGHAGPSGPGSQQPRAAGLRGRRLALAVLGAAAVLLAALFLLTWRPANPTARENGSNGNGGMAEAQKTGAEPSALPQPRRPVAAKAVADSKPLRSPKSDLERRLDRSEQLLRADPNNVDARGDRARTFLVAQQWDKAIAELSEVIRLRPADAWAFADRAVAYRNKGDRQRALADWNEAIRIQPKQVKFLNDRGLCHNSLQNWKQALADFDASIALDPDNPAVYVWRGCALNAQQEWDRAIASFDDAIKRNPKDPWAFLHRSQAIWGKGEFKEALAGFTEAIRLQPGDASFYIERGMKHCFLRDWEPAMADFNMAIVLDPRSGRGYGSRGWASRLQGKHLEALSDLNKAIELGPQTANQYLERGFTHHDLGDWKEAIADLDMAERLGLNNSEQSFYLHKVRAEDRSRIGDDRGAEVDLERAARLRAQTQSSKKTKR